MYDRGVVGAGVVVVVVVVVGGGGQQKNLETLGLINVDCTG